MLIGLPTAVLLIDEAGKVALANMRASQLLGCSRSVLIGQDISDLVAPFEELRREAGAEIPKSGSRPASGARPKPVNTRRECETTLPDGTTIRVGYRAAYVDADSERRLVVTFQDVTALVRLREERDRLLRLAIVHDVLPALLHELKNPLAAVTTSLEVLLEDMPPGDEQMQMHAMLGELRRMRLTFEGFDIGNCELHTSQHAAIDLACAGVCRILALRAEQRGARLEFDVPPMPLLPFRPSVVRAVLFNLLNNSVQACRSGDMITMRASLEDEGQMLRLEVRDGGVGMTAAVQERCTELFFSTKPTGSGLGLPLCKEVCERAGGTLRVRSRPGDGTFITVRLPVQSPTIA